MAIELRHLRYAVAVAEAGQLSRAAARLHIAQPALSQSILRLEREIGAPLFERHARGVTPTPAGDAFLEHARAAIVASDAAVSAARRSAHPDTDQLVLGFIGGVGLAEPLVSAFAVAHPDIELVVREVSFADQVDWLLDGTVDAAVLNPGPPSPEFQTIPIAGTSLCVFASEHHRLASRTELRYADVADETYLGKAPGLPDWWVDIWWLTERRGGPPRTSRRTSGTVNESLAGVMSGEVIVVSPTFFIPPIPIPGVVAIPLVDVDAPAVELVYLRDTATRAIRQLAAVARTLQPHPAADAIAEP
jgi:DNA-binding transcriptional LysR family regulator